MREFLKKAFTRQSSIVNRQSNRPFAAITVAFSTGIALSLICREYWFSSFIVADAALICACVLALRKNRIPLSLITGLAAISISGLLISLAHRDALSSSDLRSLLRKQAFPLNEPAPFEGCVDDESRRQGNESLVTVELHAVLQKDQWVVCKGKGILKIAEPGEAGSREQAVQLMRGDRVRGWAAWHVPRNYENPGSADRVSQLAHRGIFLLGKVKSPRLVERIPGDCSNPWTDLATSVGTRVQSSLKPIRELEKGQPAAILASLTIGDYSALDNDTREIFQNSGTYHILVVSGLHVAWIAGVLLQFFKFIFVPERIRYLLAAAVILLYTCVVGFQASISRCLWMFLLYLMGRMLFRRADAVNILLTSALLLLIAQPDWLFETGFQLSFLSVLAIALTAVPAIDKYLKPLCEPLRHSGKPQILFLRPGRWHRIGRSLRTRCEILIEAMTDPLPPATSKILLIICRGMAAAGLAIGSMIIVSISVQIWLEPLLAYSFNRMSWISPLANLILVPFSSVVLAAGIAASLACGIPYLGPALIRLAAALASLLLHAAARVTMINGAWQRCPTPSSKWVLGCILILFLWSFFQWRRFWIPCSCVITLLACLSFGSSPVFGSLAGERSWSSECRREDFGKKNAPVLSLTFLDVGEGDSIVIRFPDHRIWVLDGGGLQLAQTHEERAYAFDIGEAVVSRYLWHEWITRLDRLILSHTDLDHAGGIPALMKNYRISRFDYSRAGSDAILNGILEVARERHIPANLLHLGVEQRVGMVTVSTLHPSANRATGTANENSLVLKISFGNFSALLTGDLEKSGEYELLAQSFDLRSTLLKVAHHGSRNATSNSFLDRIQPRWATISVGRNNPFGHPSRDVLLRLRQHGVRTFLTLDEGAIAFETDGSRYAIRSFIRGLLEQGDLQ
jgi:competence protein ComEC